MKTFERDGKINFVDDNNVIVGFDNEGQCCESFGHFLSRKIPSAIDEGAENLDTEDFNFDTEFFKEVKPTIDSYNETEMAVFRLQKGNEEMFLTLHNTHNGYYSHGFKMDVGGVKVRDGYL